MLKCFFGLSSYLTENEISSRFITFSFSSLSAYHVENTAVIVARPTNCNSRQDCDSCNPTRYKFSSRTRFLWIERSYSQPKTTAKVSSSHLYFLTRHILILYRWLLGDSCWFLFEVVWFYICLLLHILLYWACRGTCKPINTCSSNLLCYHYFFLC